MKKVVATPVAESIPFDNDGTTLTSENLQEAVVEVSQQTSDSSVGGQSATYVFKPQDVVGGCDANGN